MEGLHNKHTRMGYQYQICINKLMMMIVCPKLLDEECCLPPKLPQSHSPPFHYQNTLSVSVYDQLTTYFLVYQFEICDIGSCDPSGMFFFIEF